MQLKMWWDNTGKEPVVKLPEGFYINYEGEGCFQMGWIPVLTCRTQLLL